MAMAGIIPGVVHAEVRGGIRIGGLDPLASPVHEIARKVGLLFQNVESQLFTASVEDEVLLPLEFGAVNADDPFAAVDRALERFGLLDRRTQKVESLSSGYKQRLALASLHLDGKSVLLLDEPFSYLDPGAVREFKGILKALAARGVAVVLAEHREDLALPLADRVVRMDGGEAPPRRGAARLPGPQRHSARAGHAGARILLWPHARPQWARSPGGAGRMRLHRGRERVRQDHPVLPAGGRVRSRLRARAGGRGPHRRPEARPARRAGGPGPAEPRPAVVRLHGAG